MAVIICQSSETYLMCWQTFSGGSYYLVNTLFKVLARITCYVFYCTILTESYVNLSLLYQVNENLLANFVLAINWFMLSLFAASVISSTAEMITCNINKCSFDDESVSKTVANSMHLVAKITNIVVILTIQSFSIKVWLQIINSESKYRYSREMKQKQGADKIESGLYWFVSGLAGVIAVVLDYFNFRLAGSCLDVVRGFFQLQLCSTMLQISRRSYMNSESEKDQSQSIPITTTPSQKNREESMRKYGTRSVAET